MKLPVPLFKQPENSNDCGIVGIQMIMHYYKDIVPFGELKKQ
ncbi:MAG: hypothetical protein Q8Q31_05560 [Nanoarchaeota archaeon]|nr:hypothetical protein [Nanoarchaeota archaeon]